MSRELWRAIGEKKQKQALELLKNGGNLEVAMTFAHAWTCLHAACERGYLDIVKKLLEMGSPTDTSDWSGETPLHSAAEHGFVEIARLLLASKVKLAPNQDGRLPCHLAARKGRYDVLKVLLDKYPALVNVQDLQGRIPLHEAAENGHLDVVKLLVVCGSNPDVRAITGETPAKLAQLNGHLSVSKYLE